MDRKGTGKSSLGSSEIQVSGKGPTAVELSALVVAVVPAGGSLAAQRFEPSDAVLAAARLLVNLPLLQQQVRVDRLHEVAAKRRPIVLLSDSCTNKPFHVQKKNTQPWT